MTLPIMAGLSVLSLAVEKQGTNYNGVILTREETFFKCVRTCDHLLQTVLCQCLHLSKTQCQTKERSVLKFHFLQQIFWKK